MRNPTVLAELRARIAEVERGGVRHAALPFGVAAIDRCLPAGGLIGGALHEVCGSPDLADDASATIFLAGILARLEGPVLWCLHWRDLFAPALHLAGLHPDRVIHVEAGGDADVLLAMEESLRHAGLAGVVGEIGKYSTTASHSHPAYLLCPLRAWSGLDGSDTSGCGRAVRGERASLRYCYRRTPGAGG